MATLTPGNFTYGEWAVRTDPTGKLFTLVNLLSQNNGILEDCQAVECNSGNAHEFTQVVKLPAPTRRQYNNGIIATMAGAQRQITTCIMYNDLVKIDDGLARLNGNLNELRAQEDSLHLEAMGQQAASDLFYGNRATDPSQLQGFSSIYSTVNSATSNIATNVIDCGGTGSTNFSIWLVGWGPKQIHTLFPNGMPSGMQHIDKGLDLAFDSNTPQGQFYAWQTWLEWNIGLCIEDWRYCVRACNIDYTLLGSGTGANIIGTLAAMVLRPPVVPAGVGPVQTSDDPARVTMARWAFYLNRTALLALDLQAQNKTNVLLKMDEWDGHPILTYRGIPLRCVDALTVAEARVV